MLITAFVHVRPEGHREPRSEVGSLSPAERLAGFEPIYINDLPNELKSNVKLFADDTSLFTVVKDKNESANILNNDLHSISTWAYNWKMLFNRDSSKPAQEVLFS